MRSSAPRSSACSALALEFAFGFVMAVLFWKTFHRVRGFATLILLPMLISPVVVGFTARMAFTDSYGFVNQVLSLLVPGGDVSLNWLSSPTLAPLVVIFADAWQWGPFMFLLLLAGLLSTSAGPDRGGARRRRARCPGLPLHRAPGDELHDHRRARAARPGPDAHVRRRRARDARRPGDRDRDADVLHLQPRIQLLRSRLRRRGLRC